MQDIRTITISLIRHASTAYQKGTLPPYDPPLAPIDNMQITRLADALPQDAPWWVSPLSRCRLTADALTAAGATSASTSVIDALEEQRYGDWHGQQVGDIWDQVKDGPKSNWHFLHPTVTPPNGESFDDLITRLHPIMDRITQSKDAHIVIIAHGMVIRGLVGLALGMDSGHSLAMACDNLSLTRLTYMAEGALDHPGTGGSWHLDHLNQRY